MTPVLTLNYAIASVIYMYVPEVDPLDIQEYIKWRAAYGEQSSNWKWMM